MAFSHQAQECFFEGHALAFDAFGAVPGRIRPDYVPRNIIGVLFPSALCGRGRGGPVITAVNEPMAAVAGT